MGYLIKYWMLVSGIMAMLLRGVWAGQLVGIFVVLAVAVHTQEGIYGLVKDYIKVDYVNDLIIKVCLLISIRFIVDCFCI
jgi:hypothetical protein